MTYYQFQGPVQGSFDDDEMRRRRRHHGVEPIPQAPQQPMGAGDVEAALQGPQPMTQQEMEAAWQGPPGAGPPRGLAADRREFEDEGFGAVRARQRVRGTRDYALGRAAEDPWVGSPWEGVGPNVSNAPRFAAAVDMGQGVEQPPPPISDHLRVRRDEEKTQPFIGPRDVSISEGAFREGRGRPPRQGMSAGDVEAALQGGMTSADVEMALQAGPGRKRVRFKGPGPGGLIQPQHVTPGAPPPRLGPIGKARRDRKYWKESFRKEQTRLQSELRKTEDAAEKASIAAATRERVALGQAKIEQKGRLAAVSGREQARRAHEQTRQRMNRENQEMLNKLSSRQNGGTDEVGPVQQ